MHQRCCDEVERDVWSLQHCPDVVGKGDVPHLVRDEETALDSLCQGVDEPVD